MHPATRRTFLKAAGATGLALWTGCSSSKPQPKTGPPATTAKRPNVVIILADDMGYGDVACYDPARCKVKTPNIDRLAAQGMMFTDAHATSAVCTPSRYGLLTGRYPWRKGIRQALKKWDPPVIPPERLTIAGQLRDQGYDTACIGKWHLGFDWPERDGQVDFTQPIAGGPNACGFDYFYGVDCPNFPPFTYMENQRITVQPTAFSPIDNEIIANHDGPMAPGWKFDQILPTLVDKSTAYIAEQAAAKKPFLLYLALTSPHYPVVPTARFKGKSGISPLADFIMETDWAVGEVMAALDRAGVADNTLLIFTTDNGHDKVPGLEPFEQAGHRVSGGYAGMKHTIEEGGHRVPFIARWPGTVPAGSRCDATICQTTMMATLADITGRHLPDNAGEDSTSILPLLKNPRDVTQCPPIVSQSVIAYAIRDGDWKLIVAIPPVRPATRPTTRPAVPVRLYNLAADPAETKNLAAEQPDRVAAMRHRLQQFIDDGRSTPGTPQSNDVPVLLRPTAT